jgi:hypothetical protein
MQRKKYNPLVRFIEKDDNSIKMTGCFFDISLENIRMDRKQLV